MTEEKQVHVDFEMRFLCTDILIHQCVSGCIRIQSGWSMF